MYLGVDWYPEQWGMELVDSDLDGICELGCSIVRIADFAWDVFEPREGEYDFAFFDEVIARVKKRGLKVMLCVPTATMPRWLNLKYPEIMAEDENGRRQSFGGRRGYCYNSPVYLEKAAALTRALAEHYKSEDAIVAWQLDNELGHEGSDLCWCENCRRGFADYLRGQYADIGELNRRWGTAFWAQTYDRFEDVPLPRQAFTAQNPSLRLEWERFRSLSLERFLAALAAALREVLPDALVLHDFSGGIWDKHYDPFAAARHVDTAAYNSYPVWGGQASAQSDAEVAFALDTARGLKGKPFWVTEAIIGMQGHDAIGFSPRPGQAAHWAMLALEHGCESLLFFRWRQYDRGAEQFCCGVLDADNRKGRKFREVQAFFRQARARESELQKRAPAKAALVFDFDSAAAFRIQRQSDAMNYEKQAQKLYAPLYERGISVDIIPSDRDFSAYSLLLVPSMTVMREDFRERLRAFVRAGGTAVLSFRTAWKDEYNDLVFGERLPVGLTALVGAEIDEQEALLAGQSRPLALADGTGGVGEVFCEMLQPTTARVLARWVDCDFGEYAAVTENDCGAGRCFYLGTSPDEATLSAVFDAVTKSLRL